MATAILPRSTHDLQEEQPVTCTTINPQFEGEQPETRDDQPKSAKRKPLLHVIKSGSLTITRFRKNTTTMQGKWRFIHELPHSTTDRRWRQMKRANGTGTVTKLSGKRRKPWVVKVSMKDADGVMHQKSLGTFSTKKAAQEALDIYNQQRRECPRMTPDKATMTIGQVYDAWQVKGFQGLSPKGIKHYTSAWNRRLEPIRDTPIREMGVDEWQALIDADLDAGLGRDSIKNLITTIHALNGYAMDRDIIAKDYSTRLENTGKAGKYEKGALTPEQVEALKKMAADGVPYADTVLMLCYTGFRIEEYLSLEPDDYHPEYGGYLQNGNKTDAGINRIVPIHKCIKPYFDAYLARHGDAIICQKNGKRWSYVGYKYHFNKIMEKLGIPQATPHWCRHTFVSMMAQAKLQDVVQKWLVGHSTEDDITHHYTHSTIKQLRDAMDSVQ